MYACEISISIGVWMYVNINNVAHKQCRALTSKTQTQSSLRRNFPYMLLLTSNICMLYSPTAAMYVSELSDGTDARKLN